MKFDSQYIKKLIFDANQLLLKDEVNEISKKALMDCLETVQKNELLQECTNNQSHRSRMRKVEEEDELRS